ncbi:hypothetical protein T440DRAFT_503612 [Plenodomus tracheiphilus IPT5]|uniref:Uncharacterized protein n=1 Tax=Plenodomus tracheiphilus IPT5 TaxID=1408161 RepID=A0A6A7BR85_9PLEO|nr:hypothetical protein T440DRAFT_503612 [Plenodomus tracheiphilus IPT5]
MAGNKDVSLSAREMEVLALAWQCMDTQPKIDMQKLASLTGYTPGSASVTMGNIKRKLKVLGDSLSSNALTTPKKTGGGPGRGKTGTPKTPTGTKRGATTNKTPNKRQKKSGRQEQRDEEEDEDDGEEMLTTDETLVKEEPAEGGEEAYAMLEGLGNFVGHDGDGDYDDDRP